MAVAAGCCSAAMSVGGQAIGGRWFMVYATILIMAASGAIYMFGIYSGDIKSSLGYDQRTLNLLSFFKDLGGAVGILPGLLMEVAPPWVVLAAGSALNFFGYFMIWLAVTGRIAKPALWQMCLYISIGANSQAFSNTGALVTCVKSFPESRGGVIGLLKGFLGLSGAIITQLYHAIYFNDSKSLILFIGWLPAAISLVFLRVVRFIKPVSDVGELKTFYQLLYASLGLAGFLMLVILLQLRIHFSHPAYISSAITILLLFCLPLYTVFRQDLKQHKQTSFTSVPESTVSTEHRIKEVDGCFENVFQPPERGEDYTILQALFSIDMLILFTVTTFGAGGALTAIDNLGQIGASLGYPTKSISTFVSLVSIWNYLGRVVAGFLSEHFLSTYKFPRPLMLTFVLLLSCSGYLLIAFGVSNGLYLASVVIGFSYGAQWPLLFAIISEIFGLKYYSTLFNFGTIASPIGGYILNVKVAGYLYDKEANKQMAQLGQTRKVGEELNCNGVQCYRLAFVIITAVTVFAMFVSLVLVVRTRRFYQSDIYSKFREAGETVEEVVEGGEIEVAEDKKEEARESRCT